MQDNWLEEHQRSLWGKSARSAKPNFGGSDDILARIKQIVIRLSVEKGWNTDCSKITPSSRLQDYGIFHRAEVSYYHRLFGSCIYMTTLRDAVNEHFELKRYGFCKIRCDHWRLVSDVEASVVACLERQRAKREEKDRAERAVKEQKEREKKEEQELRNKKRMEEKEQERRDRQDQQRCQHHEEEEQKERDGSKKPETEWTTYERQGEGKVIRPSAFRGTGKAKGAHSQYPIHIQVVVKSHQERTEGIVKSYITRELCSIKDVSTTGTPEYRIRVTAFETKDSDEIVMAVAFTELLDTSPLHAILSEKIASRKRSLKNDQDEPTEPVKSLTSLLLFQGVALNQLGKYEPYESILNLQVWKCPVERLRSLVADLVADFDGNALEEQRQSRIR